MIKNLFYRGPSFESLHEDYAKNGRIDEKAPVRSSATTYIDTPVERVWNFLINLPQWEAIDPSFSDVRTKAGISVDAYFNFKLNNFPIRAKFAVVKPRLELHWTDVSLWFKAIDLHTLESISNAGTRLTVAESFAGPLASLFISSEKLRVQHERWLSAFKRAVENSPLQGNQLS